MSDIENENLTIAQIEAMDLKDIRGLVFSNTIGHNSMVVRTDNHGRKIDNLQNESRILQNQVSVLANELHNLQIKFDKLPVECRMSKFQKAAVILWMGISLLLAAALILT